MKILGIGEAVIDKISIVHSADHLPSGELVVSQHDAGGPILAGLILLARLGADCSFITSLGQDKEGQLIRGILSREGITLIENLQNITKQNTVLVDAKTGEREKIRGDIKHTPIQGIRPAFVRSFDMIIMDRHERLAFHEVVSHMDTRTQQLITDPSTEVSEFARKMMQHTTCPIIPIESLAEMGAGLSLEQALDKLEALCGQPFVVTLGELGSLVRENSNTQHIAAVAVDTIDTNGAGDIYRGAFAFGQLQDWNLTDCVTYANTVAALQCTKHGNAAAIPTKHEVEQAVQNATHHKADMQAVRHRFQELSEASMLPKDIKVVEHSTRNLYHTNVPAFAI